MNTNDVDLEKVEQLMDMLQGNLPDDVTLGHPPPTMTREQAFSIVWFLQEITRVLPDSIEMCVCGALFDSNNAGHTVGEYDEWYENFGIPQSLVAAHEGANFCDSTCELRFFRGLMSDDLPTA